MQKQLIFRLAATVCLSLMPQTRVWAQDGQEKTVISVCALRQMSCEQLEAVYRSGSAPEMPCGRLRGTTIVRPGSSMSPALSKGAAVVWQGKEFCPHCATATNRFFGVRAVKARVYPGASLLDGRPSLVLDYSQTSFVYSKVRDEIREVSPGVYLGLMYRTDCCDLEFRRFFVLESCTCCR